METHDRWYRPSCPGVGPGWIARLYQSGRLLGTRRFLLDALLFGTIGGALGPLKKSQSLGLAESVPAGGAGGCVPVFVRRIGAKFGVRKIRGGLRIRVAAQFLE